MKTSTMQRIDRTVGPLLGPFLLGLRGIFGPRRKAGPNGPTTAIKKILVLKFLGMGTLLLASPALRRLKVMHPGAKVVLFTLVQNEALAEMLPGVDEVVVIRINDPWQLLKSLSGVLPGLIRQRFDAVIDLEFFANFSALITAFLTLFHPGILAVGYDFPGHWRNRLHQKRGTFHHQKHISVIMGDLMDALLPDFQGPQEISFEPEKRIFFEKAQTDLVMEVLMPRSGNLPFVVTLNINSGDLCKNREWPLEHFRTVVTELQGRKNILIFLIGGAADVPHVAAFIASLPSQEKVVNFCGRASFHQLLGIFSKTDLLITNDSGPLHIATVMTIPTIVFFGPETPLLYGPVGERSHVFYRELACSPCLSIYNSKYHVCHDNQCLKTITPEQVMKVVDAEINSAGAHKP